MPVLFTDVTSVGNTMPGTVLVLENVFEELNYPEPSIGD